MQVQVGKHVCVADLAGVVAATGDARAHPADRGQGHHEAAPPGPQQRAQRLRLRRVRHARPIMARGHVQGPRLSLNRLGCLRA